MDYLTCKKGLYKASYKSFAFKKDKQYEIFAIDNTFVWVKDEMGKAFNFCLEKNDPFYCKEDYFK